MPQFAITVPFGSDEITVTGDTLEETMEAAQELRDLNKDAMLLFEHPEIQAKEVHVTVRTVEKDGDSNTYYGFRDPATGANTTFGQYKPAEAKKRRLPFFPGKERKLFIPRRDGSGDGDGRSYDRDSRSGDRSDGRAEQAPPPSFATSSFAFGGRR